MKNEKKAIKKLQLNKKTIAALTNDEMYIIKGGDADEGDAFGSRLFCAASALLAGAGASARKMGQ